MAFGSDVHVIDRFRTIMFLPLVVPSPSKEKTTSSTQFRRDSTKALLDDLARACGDGQPWEEIHDKLEHLSLPPGKKGPGDPAHAPIAADGEGMGEPPSADGTNKGTITGSAGDVGFDERMKYQEFVYFHGFIQKLLFADQKPDDTSAAGEDLRLFRRTDIRQVRITTARSDDGKLKPFTATLTCERFNLYVFPVGVAILCVEVMGEAKGVVLNHEQKSEATTLTHVLALQNAVRRVYPPYFAFNTAEAKAELREFPTTMEFIGADGVPLARDGRSPQEWIDSIPITRKPGEGLPRHTPMSQAWRDMLLPLRVEGDPQASESSPPWRQVVDERMPCMTFISCPTAGRWRDPQWMRLVYMDQPGDGFAYSTEFEPDWKARYCYDRHWYGKSGTRYLISPYSFITVGTPFGDMFPTIIEQHFRRMYADMMLLNQFQFAALLALSNWISDAVPEPGAEQEGWKRQRLRNEIRELRAIYVSFIQQFWFTNVSNQIQARELYARMREQIGTVTIYEEVSRQLADVNEYLEAQEQADQSDAAMKLNVLAAAGLGASVPLAVLALVGEGVPWFRKFAVEQATPLVPARWMMDVGVTLSAVGLGYLFLGILLRAITLDTQRSQAANRVIELLSKLWGICLVAAAMFFLAAFLDRPPQ